MGVIRELLNDKNSKSIIHDNDRERLAAFTNSQRLSTQYDVSNPRLVITLCNLLMNELFLNN